MEEYKKDPSLLNFRKIQYANIPDTKDIWNSSFHGVVMIQSWQDLMLWERFLNLVEPKAVVEIGTFTGGFSLFLHGQCYSRNSSFFTVDFMEYAEFNKEGGALWVNGVYASFIHSDCWKEPFTTLFSKIANDVDNFPVLVFCDGGNKPLEMKTFSRIIKPGNYMATHDWGNEISDGDIVGLPIEFVMKEECEQHGSLTRFFKII